jgi:hypothetical protein
LPTDKDERACDGEEADVVGVRTLHDLEVPLGVLWPFEREAVPAGEAQRERDLAVGLRLLVEPTNDRLDRLGPAAECCRSLLELTARGFAGRVEQYARQSRLEASLPHGAIVARAS